MRHDRVAHLHGILRSMSTVTRLFAASGACPFTDRARGRYGSAAGHQQHNQPSSSVAPPDLRRDRRSKSCRLPQPHNPNDPNCRRRSRKISQRVHAHSSAIVCCAIHPGTVRTLRKIHTQRNLISVVTTPQNRAAYHCPWIGQRLRPSPKCFRCARRFERPWASSTNEVGPAPGRREQDRRTGRWLAARDNGQGQVTRARYPQGVSVFAMRRPR